MIKNVDPNCSVIIDNCIVTKLPTMGLFSTSIKSLKNRKVDLSCLPGVPRISLGSRSSDNKLISEIMDIDRDELLTIEEILEKYKPEERGVNTTLFPDLCPETKKRALKVRKTQRIKRELLETSAKICMNPRRIERLLEENAIDLDDTATFYDL